MDNKNYTNNQEKDSLLNDELSVNPSKKKMDTQIKSNIWQIGLSANDNVVKDNISPVLCPSTLKEYAMKENLSSNDSINEIITFRENEWNKMLKTVGSLPSETGGLLLGFRNDFIIRHFEFDKYGSVDGSSYSPDTDFCNQVMREYSEKQGYQFLGMVHSHPRGVSRLSGEWGDIGYIRKIFKAMPSLPKIIVPIIFSTASGVLEVFPYVVYRENPDQPVLCEILIVN